MVEKVHALLQEYEDKQAAGKIKTFIVKILDESLQVLPEPSASDEAKSISLAPDLQNSLEIFFSDIQFITFGSFDYATLKSLLNAHCTLERMANKSGNSAF
ncbi:hypothetical protein H8S95_01525 [Pontibacter sp. KCTC 32443]|uniref:hypothetical protein n=1 Tax=Pontibacter TaxID=323449 RepID=UPI00164D36C7|nr:MULTISPECIES: hypothetical protein [Pontibacter]MBC5772729.1 hypothetical protein [Pontibacter sp. KCTC 32443]